MHEFSLVKREVERLRKKIGEKKVKKIVFYLGRLAHGNPDSIKQAFKVAALNTPLDETELKVVTIEPKVKCSSCGSIFDADSNINFSCLNCNSNLNELISGDECHIDSVEVED